MNNCPNCEAPRDIRQDGIRIWFACGSYTRNEAGDLHGSDLCDARATILTLRHSLKEIYNTAAFDSATAPQSMLMELPKVVCEMADKALNENRL